MKEKRKSKKKIRLIGVIVIIVIALSIPFVFAMPMANTNMQKKEFFSVDSTQKTAGSILEMSLNIDCIQYDNFTFTLTNQSELNLSDVDISEAEKNSELEMKKEDSCITITANKTEMSVDAIKIYYQIPQDLEIGTKLTFKAEIEEENKGKEENKKEEVEKDNQVNEIVNEMIDEKIEDSNLPQQSQTKQEMEITITIIAGDKENNENKEEQNQANIQQSNKTQNMQSSISSSRSTSQQETITYNGSSNNYLKKLEVEGYRFNQKFAKENTTYFIALTDKDTDTLKITATAEDSSATVCVYGNEEIKEGSKILISVTAENGNVRTYRIYVTK